MGASLRVSRLCKSYGSLAVLDNWDLEVEPGERLVLLGPSGCGKTTFLRIVAGLEGPTSGDVRRESARIGFVFQEPRLIPWLSVRDNVRFVNEGADCSRLLADLGLRGFEGYLPAQVSGGMRQRVGLARALAVEPDLLVLDEAFAALDLKARAAAMADVQRLWQERRFTLVAVAHDPREAVLLADRIAILSTRPASIRRVMPVNLGDEQRPTAPAQRPTAPEQRLTAPEQRLTAPDVLRLEAELIDAILDDDS